MRNKVRKKVRAKNVEKHRRRLEDQRLIDFHKTLADEIRAERQRQTESNR
ncbi:hypothetical protein HWC80_gp059 [Mycobacterium phage Indlulamithi]|uniref:Uncharacterized protein n=1 Tax=Mycobacterium phage Indlulamithi TaxID=2656582 RepID=A0A649VCN6_9CAUD|nr:hypothetical protein HWC80_gp059 [Mycobacterium phage Indlulamithi]QGJ90098.1 hypothetical protein PBI_INDLULAMITHI_59 [Mycobacterium phage Indlulamithi]